MQRRNFFKNLIAAVAGLFAVSNKSAKAQGKLPKSLNNDVGEIKGLDFMYEPAVENPAPDIEKRHLAFWKKCSDNGV